MNFLWLLGISGVSYLLYKAGNKAVDNLITRPGETPGGKFPDAPGLNTPGFFIESGTASWYGPGYAGKLTANGETFIPAGFTAAHKTLPFGTKVKVVDNETGKSVVVRINDRGPFVGGRIIDLAEGAAVELGLRSKGLTNVSLSVA